MLNLAYMGIAFALVFYVVFGLAVRFMELTQVASNKARLIILLASLIIFSISGVTAGVLNLYQQGLNLYGIVFIVLGITGVIFILSIFFEIHQINTRVRMRRFMVLFDIVDRYLSEGKTREEVFEYLTKIQKLKNKKVSAVITLSEESRRMQDMMKMYASGGMGGMDMFPSDDGAILTLNAGHPLVKYIIENEGSSKAELIEEQIYDLAMISNKQLSPDDMTRFVNRSNEIMQELIQ